MCGFKSDMIDLAKCAAANDFTYEVTRDVCGHSEQRKYPITFKVAIVGSEEKKWTGEQKEKAKRVIKEILTSYPKPILVSGGCHRGGVDIWAEEIADELGIDKIIFPAKIHCWSGKGGYRDRNIKIAETCDVLYDIEPKGKRSGGTWTANYAKKLGKRVYLITIT